MGRDKPKKYEKMNFQQKSIYNDKLAKKYNINKDDFNTAQGGGGGRYDNINDAAYEKAIKNAMRMSDFDYRTSAPHMDGVKGDASFNDYSKYEREAQKLHKQAGNGGEYSSNKDITTVTSNLVRDKQREFRDDIMSEMNAKYASAARLNELQDSIQKRAKETGPTEISSTLTNAQRSVGDFDEDMTAQGANIFGAMGPSNDLEFATEEVQTNEASGDGEGTSNPYTDQYKLNVKGGLELSGIKTRGPGSGINGEGF